jgi:hypothetical protein
VLFVVGGAGAEFSDGEKLCEPGWIEKREEHDDVEGKCYYYYIMRFWESRHEMRR